jgi:RimJ/RimL family protein N-acetyltransferase
MKTFIAYMFSTMELDRIYLKTLDWNFRAQRCFEKAGFKRYGTSRRGEYNFVLMEIRRGFGVAFPYPGYASRLEGIRIR